MAGHLAVRERRLCGQRLEVAPGEQSAVGLVPDVEPLAYLVVAERLQLQREQPGGEADPVGHHRAAGHDDRDGPALRRLPGLELAQPLQVVVAAELALHQLVEPVQQDHRHRAVPRRDQVGVGDLLPQHLRDGLLDLLDHSGAGPYGAQLHPDRQELRPGQPRAEHLGQLGLARARLPEHEQRRLGGAQRGEVPGQERLGVGEQPLVVPPAPQGGQGVAGQLGHPAARAQVALAEQRQRDVLRMFALPAGAAGRARWRPSAPGGSGDGRPRGAAPARPAARPPSTAPWRAAASR